MNHILLAGGGNSLISPDPGLFFWTVLIFVILWILLGKFAFKPIAKALKDRENRISDALNQAEKAREEMATLTARNEELLNEAKEQKAIILREAKETGERIVEEAKDKAKIEASKAVEDARREIDNQKKAALAEVKNEVGKMAIGIAETIMKKELAASGEAEGYVKQLVEEANMN